MVWPINESVDGIVIIKTPNRARSGKFLFPYRALDIIYVFYLECLHAFIDRAKRLG